MEPRRFSDTPLHVSSTSSLVPGGFPARKSGKYSISTTTAPLTRKKVPRCNMSIRSCRHEVLVLYICMYEYIRIVLCMYFVRVHTPRRHGHDSKCVLRVRLYSTSPQSVVLCLISVGKYSYPPVLSMDDETVDACLVGGINSTLLPPELLLRTPNCRHLGFYV